MRAESGSKMLAARTAASPSRARRNCCRGVGIGAPPLVVWGECTTWGWRVGAPFDRLRVSGRSRRSGLPARVGLGSSQQSNEARLLEVPVVRQRLGDAPLLHG